MSCDNRVSRRYPTSTAPEVSADLGEGRGGVAPCPDRLAPARKADYPEGMSFSRVPRSSLRALTGLTALATLTAAGLLAACVGTDPVPGGETPASSATTSATGTSTTPGADGSVPDSATGDSAVADGAIRDAAVPDAADAAPPPPATVHRTVAATAVIRALTSPAISH